MENNVKNILVSVVTAVIVVGLAFMFVQQDNQGTPIPQEQLGATPGNVVEGKYFTVGGVEYAYVSQGMYATSSVPCAFRSPFATATTSAQLARLVSFSAQFSDTMLATHVVSLSTSTHPVLAATSSKSLVFEYPLPSSSAASFFWEANQTGSTTKLYEPQDMPADGSSPFFLRANESIGLKIATSTPGGDKVAGRCAAVFQKI